MSLAQGSISFDSLKVNGAPFPSNAAENGLSVDSVTGRIVYGQNTGAAGNPALLTSNREIPNGGFNTYYTGAGNRWFGERAVEGTNFNFFDTAKVLAYREATTSANISGYTLAASQYLFLNNGSSLSSITSRNTSSVLRIKGTTNFTGSVLASIRNDLFITRASDFVDPLIVNAPANPTEPLANQIMITGAVNAGTITLNGFYAGANYRIQLQSGTHTITSYSDIILGNSSVSGPSTVGTRYGIYINPIKQAFVTGTGYSIFQEGTTDVNHFAGVFRLVNLPVFADEAAATAGGLATNTVYRTATGEMRIKL